MPAAEERGRVLGRQASEKPRGRKPRAGVARRCRAGGLSMGIGDRCLRGWHEGGAFVGRGAGREIAIAERGWTIVTVDGDGAVCDLTRRSGHWTSPFFSA